MDEISLALHGFDPEPRDVIDVATKHETLPAPQEQNVGGAPSIYSAEVASAICERIAAGESVRSIARSPGMPSRATIYRWVVKNEDFRAAYALAMRCRIDDMADECLEIADDGSRT
jgi:hypothetical protein